MRRSKNVWTKGKNRVQYRLQCVCTALCCTLMLLLTIFLFVVCTRIPTGPRTLHGGSPVAPQKHRVTGHNVSIESLRLSLLSLSTETHTGRGHNVISMSPVSLCLIWVHLQAPTQNANQHETFQTPQNTRQSSLFPFLDFFPFNFQPLVPQYSQTKGGGPVGRREGGV